MRVVEETKEICRLEKELAPYYSSIAPVHDCPAEILSAIFRFCLEETPRLTRHLMLVCKQWYHVVVGDATLWTKISVSFDTPSSMQEVIRSTNLYIEACNRYSCNLPIDLELNFGGLVLSPRRGVYPLKWREATELKSSASSDASGEETDAAENAIADPTAAPDPIQATKLVPALLGHNSSVLGRCGAIYLVFPHNASLAQAIWLSLSFDTPELNRLSIYDAGLAYQTYGRTFSGGFKHLSALKHLEIDEVPNLDFIDQIGDVPLESLSLYTDLGASGALGLDRYTGLIVLTISCTYASFELEEGIPSNRLSLPLLRELILIGNFTAINEVQFDLPQLQYLYIQHEASESAEGFVSLPSVSAPTVDWTNRDPYHDLWSRRGARIHLTGVLTNFLNSEFLIMPVRGKKILLSVIQDLRAAGSVPGKWREVSLENDENEVMETVTISAIV